MHRRHRPTPLRPSLCGLLLLALAGAQPAAAQDYGDTPFKPDAEPDVPKSVKPGRKWQEREDEVRLPAWPRDGDLIEVKVDGPARPTTHYIDRRSLNTGRDGVVRYTLVAESPNGTRNLNFEGLRCTPKGHWKVYAYGANGRFEAIAGPIQWRQVGAQTSDPLHFDLWRHYLCVHRGFTPRPTRDQVRMLKSGRVPSVENTGFITN